MNEFKIKSSDLDFRVKKMNAIEILAVRANIGNRTVEESMKSFKTILECIEVRCDNSWIPAKMQGREVYFPDGLENDVNIINELLGYFMGTYLKAVFQKSNESN